MFELVCAGGVLTAVIGGSAYVAYRSVRVPQRVSRGRVHR